MSATLAPAAACSILLIKVGTLVKTVALCRAMSSNKSSGVGCSRNSTVDAPTANGNIRLVPVA